MNFGDAASALLFRRSAFSIEIDLREAFAAGATWAADNQRFLSMSTRET
jgi:hypothetical protein